MEFSIVFKCKENINSFEFDSLRDAAFLTMQNHAICDSPMQVDESRMLVLADDGSDAVTLYRVA